MAFEPHDDIWMLKSAHTPMVKQSPSAGWRWMWPCGGVLLLSLSLGAQTTASAPNTTAPSPPQIQAKTQAHPGVHRTKKHGHAKAAAATAAAPTVPPSPPPLPPAQQSAHPATITFAHGSLSIDAQNSSLMQILDQITRQTGLVVEGFNQDERIYGQFGPGTVAGTLTDLLDGSAYNYILIGAGGDTPPTKLLLTPGNGSSGSAVPASAPPPAVNAGNTPPSADAQPAQPASSADAAHPKTAQEIFDELRKMHPQ